MTFVLAELSTVSLLTYVTELNFSWLTFNYVLENNFLLSWTVYLILMS